MADQVYDIDGVELYGNGIDRHVFTFELGLVAENYLLMSVSDRPDIGWVLQLTRNTFLDVDYEDYFVETNASFSVAPLNFVAEEEKLLVLTQPPLGQMRLKKIHVEAGLEPYSLLLKVELDGGLILSLNDRPSWTLTDSNGTVLSTVARFEANVVLFINGPKQELVIYDEAPLNSNENKTGDERADNLKMIRELGASKQWEAIPQLLFHLRSRKLDKNYCRAASRALSELLQDLGGDCVSMESWELLSWFPSRAIHIIKDFDDHWLELLPAFRAILLFKKSNPDAYGVIGDWLADKDDARATDVIAAGFEANLGDQKIEYSLSRSLGKAGDPRVLPYLLNQIDSSRHPPIVGWNLQLIETVLTKAAHLCDVATLRRIAELRAFAHEVIDVTEEAMQWDSHMTTDKIVELDISKVRALAAVEIKRRGV